MKGVWQDSQSEDPRVNAHSPLISCVTGKMDDKTKTKQKPLNSPLLPIISPVAMCLCSSSHREEESIFLHFESGLALWNAVCRRMGPNCDVLPALSHSSRGHAYLQSSLGVPPGCHGKKLHLASRSWVSHLSPQKTQACERAQSRPANRVQMLGESSSKTRTTQLNPTQVTDP